MQNDDHRLFALSCLHYSKTEKLKRQDRASFFVLKSQGESPLSVTDKITSSLLMRWTLETTLLPTLNYRHVRRLADN